MNLKKCVFFDRDGIINESPGEAKYVTSWDEFKFVTDFAICAEIAANAGYEIIVITNQRAVALGLISIETLEDIHDRLRTILKEKYGLTLTDVFYCPHHRDSCDCRKPKPGMLLEAAKKHAIALDQSWMIGDNVTDVMAGQAAGCKTILVGKSTGDVQPDFIAIVMKHVAEILRRNE